jgi:hypothetical protein
MAKLTDAQRIVLSSAAARDDGAADVPANMHRAAAAKVGSSLIARKLMREVKAKPGMPIWREDEKGRPISLTITKDGREAIGVEENGDEGAPAQGDDNSDAGEHDGNEYRKGKFRPVQRASDCMNLRSRMAVISCRWINQKNWLNCSLTSSARKCSRR